MMLYEKELPDDCAYNENFQEKRQEMGTGLALVHLPDLVLQYVIPIAFIMENI